jgi:superfamily II DNA/RNA helicase
MTTSFSDLGVPEVITAALERRGITEPFEIQAATIADAMAGRDVCGRAPTGSGKTLAFGIPLIAGAVQAKPYHPTALVLAPTRELAEQITTEIRLFSGKVSVSAVYGGVGYGPQLKALRDGVDILVACPGRLEDLIERRDVDLSAVSTVVLDEADRMADMGFMPSVRRLLDQTKSDRQTVLFSATLDGDVAKLTRDYQNDPVRHEVGEETPDITAASHVFWNSKREDRINITAEAVNAVWPAVIFTRTRHGADRLAKQLDRTGIKAVPIHGGRSQGQRTRALADFTKGRAHALVATDVAARGIHVDGVASVIHYDPPEDHKTYVHRSGRTARAGEGGVVVSLVQKDQEKDLRKMQRQIGLDEPFTEPDAVALRAMSPTPTRTLAPARPEDRPQRNGSKNSSSRSAKNNSNRRGPQSSNSNSRGRSDSRSESRDDRPKRDSRPESRDRTESRDDRPKRDSRDDNRGPKKRNASAGPKNSQGKKSNPKRKKARHAAGVDDDGRPNRAARRAHLQQGTS